jgi:hypothetical protein
MEEEVPQAFTGVPKLQEQAKPQAAAKAAAATFVRAPAKMVGIRVGKRMRVKEEFLSDEHCPYGPGKKCQLVEGGYVVIQTETAKGNVWVKSTRS